MKILHLALIAIFTVSCGLNKKDNDKGDPIKDPGPTPDDIADAPSFEHKSADEFNTRTKAFLIAGGSDIANFAQEVVDMKAALIDRGMNADDVACYFVPPTESAYEDDEHQYETLRSELTDCYIGSLANLRKHTSKVEKKSEVFFYLTSHGSGPLSWRMEKSEDPEDKEAYREFLASYPEFDQHRFILDAVDDRLVGWDQTLQAIDDGEEVLLTPSVFQNMLADWPSSSKKYAVIQACYSGGFIWKDQAEDNLRSISNITVMTAAIHDRSSFGCGPGNERTFFGGAFIENLENSQAGESIFDLSYKKLFDKTKADVETMEAEENFDPSLPQYFSNQ